MKTKEFGFAALFFFFTITLYGQNWQLEWDKQFGNQKMDYFADVVEAQNGGFTVLGSIFPKGASSFELWLIRLNEKGDTLWSRTFGTEFKDIPQKLIQNKQGEYLVLGNYLNGNTTKIFLTKTNEAGNVIWTKVFDDDFYYLAEDLVAFGDENYLLVGSKSANSESSQLWMACVNESGNMIWEKQYENNFNGCCKSVKILPDEGFAVAGQIQKNGKNECSVWVFRGDKNGEKIWSSIIPTPGLKVWPECICCSPDSCFMVAGWQGTCLNDINSENPIFDYDIFLSKLNCEGKVLLTKNFDSEGSEGGNYISMLPNGQFIVAGIKATSFMGKIGPWIVWVDDKGNMLDEKLIDMHFNNDQAVKILNCSDGGIVVIGPGIQDESFSRSNGWIMKFSTL